MKTSIANMDRPREMATSQRVMPLIHYESMKLTLPYKTKGCFSCEWGNGKQARTTRFGKEIGMRGLPSSLSPWFVMVSSPSMRRRSISTADHFSFFSDSATTRRLSRRLPIAVLPSSFGRYDPQAQHCTQVSGAHT